MSEDLRGLVLVNIGLLAMIALALAWVFLFWPKG